MKEINDKWLEGSLKEFKKDEKLRVLQRCLAKNSIDASTYVLENETHDNFMFSIDIPTMTATNQKQSGRCWIFAGLNLLREIIAKKYNIESFELSQNYIAFYDKLEKINYTLESLISLKDKDNDDRVVHWILSNGIADGGQWDMFVNIVQKYGVVSKEAMLETAISSETRTVNYLVNAMLRKFNEKIRKENNIKEIQKIKDKTMKDAYKLLCTCFGTPPSEFDFEYVDKNKAYHIERKITPKQFYKDYLKDNLSNYVSIVNAPTSDKPYNEVYTVDYLNNVIGGNEIKYLNLRMDEFKELVLKQLKNKELVWFGSDCSRYGDRQNGLWDDKLFAYDDSFGIDLTLSKESSLDNRHSAMNHAMVISGVNLVEDVPTRWKIENSWGTNAGNKGYYMCSDSWFDRFVYQAVVDKKYLSAKQRKCLEKEVKHLKPWDPMGTLAD